MPFMRGLRITGGNRLSGTIAAHGAKNAVLPILAATVLCSRSEIKNCPNLSDVAVSCHILRHLGFAVERARDTLIITREDTGCRDVPSEWMRAMRSSILFLGGMLARCGSVTLCPPGGCALGGRPIDLHLSALRQMGAVISEEGDTLRCAAPGGLHGAAVQLPYPSVGATENLLIAAAGTPAETKITGAAAEPEISDLLAYLRGCGALIESQPDGAILVQGREALTGCCCHAILPDRIEAATYLAAAAITGGEITVYASPEHLAAPLAALRRMGCRITTGEQSCKPSLWRWPPRQRATPPLPKRSFPGAGPMWRNCAAWVRISRWSAVMQSSGGCPLSGQPSPAPICAPEPLWY